jgi:hypothetical protein
MTGQFAFERVRRELTIKPFNHKAVDTPFTSASRMTTATAAVAVRTRSTADLAVSAGPVDRARVVPAMAHQTGAVAWA